MSAGDSDLLAAPVVELAALVKQGAVSPLELVDAHIAAILAWNPIINAVVANRFGDARKEARAHGELLAHTRSDDRQALPPLLGVPCTVKECFGVKGLPYTAGSLLRRDVVAANNAVVVDRVIAAGAIPLAVTNMPEMAMWMETDNRVYGRTNNPWDKARTPGGSSGGEAAIVAAGASPFGVASDVGGSIRLPAFFCGVYGHKTTGGLVPGDGHVPAPSALARSFVGIGPIARSARDLGPLLDVMSAGASRTATSPVLIRDLTVHLVVGDGKRALAPSIRTALARAAAALQARGARVVHTELPELKDAFDLWGDSLKQTADKSFESWLGDGADVGLVRELARTALRRGTHTLPALVFLAIERASSRVDFTKGGRQKALAFQERIVRLLGTHEAASGSAASSHGHGNGNGVILFPTYTTTAPLHGAALRRPGDFVLCAIWNVLGVASTQVPIGHDGQGLPSGVQVIGAPGNDCTTIAVAMALEEDLGGWTAPTRPRP